jgi:ribosome-associated protein
MDEPKSKSQKKREADTLQKVGVELVGLSLEKLDTLPLTDNLRQAILDAKSLRSHGAVRRQAQLIGKLMRSADSEAILAGYELLLAEGSAKTAEFHVLEQWRTRLLNEDKGALTELIAAHPQIDVPQLRQLIKKAVDEQKSDQHTGASKALFRYLRSSLE